LLSLPPTSHRARLALLSRFSALFGAEFDSSIALPLGWA